MSSSKSNPQIVLRPQDLVVLLSLTVHGNSPTTYAAMAADLSLTASETHAAVKRTVAAQLARKDSNGKPLVVRDALRSFIQHGARYCFPATRGSLTRGMPTSYAATPLKDRIVQSADPIPVWPYKNGTARGLAFYPLYPTVPKAAERNAALYELLVLFDAIRGGSLRERALALELLDTRLKL
jgi:hypothetical protein